MRAFRTMLKVELKLSLRGMDMFIFSICLPLVVLAVIAMLYGTRPAFAGAPYTFVEQSFPALATISICAGGVMGLPLVVSDYRSRGILRRFRVTPVSPALILLVQVVIYALYALGSLFTLWAVAVLVLGLQLHGSIPLFLLSYLMVMATMFCIGVLVGGVAANSKSAGIFTSILYFPMLLFSGATLPYEVLPAAAQKIADLLPLTQGIKLLKAALLGLPVKEVWISILVMVVLIVACAVLAIRLFRWE